MRGTITRRPALLPLLAALAGPAVAHAGDAPDAASAEASEKAQRHYDEGAEHFRAGRFDAAAAAFLRSYEEVTSPNAHLMYARALAASGDRARAYEELALTVREARQLAERVPRYAEAAQKAETELAALLPHVAVLDVDVSPAEDAVLFVGDRQVPAPRWSAIGVAAGPVDVVARLPGGRRLWKLVTASPGKITPVELDIDEAGEPPAAPAQVATVPAPQIPPPRTDAPDDPIPPDESDRTSLRPFAYGAFAVGAAGLGTFAVAGSMSRGTFSDLEAACRGGVCPESRADDIDRGKSQQTIANVGLVVGLLGAGGGVALWLIDGAHEGGSGTRARVALGPGSVGVAGSFR